MSLQNRFSAEDLERIRAAVKKAEDKISGEIVPVFVERSGSYSLSGYRAALLFGAITFLAIVLFDRYEPSYAIYDPLMILISVSIGALTGALLANNVDFIKRLMLTQKHLDVSTYKRAETAFLEQEVFNTRHRTGIMIFVSFFEHEVIVMADRGISKVVEQKEWDVMVGRIIEKIRVGNLTEGIEAAILRCGEILLEKGFLKTADDINELRDDLRLES